MNLDILLSPPIAFVIFLVIGLGIFGVGRLMAGKLKVVGGKLEPYACGENFEAEKFIYGYRKFYIAAIFFTIMHVAALTVATATGGVAAWRAVLYLVVIAASISALYVKFD
jgi:NADH:ubiquinone oxidoreductase subunit 3 (subunit A)